MSDKITKVGKILRTSAGLRESLFTTIEKVRDGEMDATQAKAIAILAQQICATVELEIMVAKLRTDYPSDTKLTIPGQLLLGDNKE
jgi:hypothetical protein